MWRPKKNFWARKKKSIYAKVIYPISIWQTSLNKKGIDYLSISKDYKIKIFSMSKK